VSSSHAMRRLLATVLCAVLASVPIVGCGRKSATASSASLSSKRPSAVATSTSGSHPSSADGTASAPGVKLPRIAPANLLEPPSYTGFEQLPSFTYHHVSPRMKNDIAITPAKFESQLKILKRLGYHTITARQLVDHQTKGTPLPDKPVMLTFDDGWRNQYEYAWPLLKKYGFTATFFVNPRLISRQYLAYMKPYMVVALAKAGNDIESHTWRHLRLTRTNVEVVAEFQRRSIHELRQADAWITTTVGQAPVALCYPYGYYDLETIGLAQAAGYKAAFSVDEGVADARPWDAYQMKRFTIGSGETPASFRLRLLSGPLPVSDIRPAPGTRVVGSNTTVTVDVTDVPADMTGLRLTGGSTLRHRRVVQRAGRKYYEAVIQGGKIGFRALTLRAKGPDGRMYYASWGIEIGDKPL
jgi:peptidoglycan/xylan/chitin deacetylase (PgdA/CDA1 family)